MAVYKCSCNGERWILHELSEKCVPADAGADADDAAENEVRDGAAVPTPTTSGESGTALPDIDDDF